MRILGWLKCMEDCRPLPVLNAQWTDDGEVYVTLAQ
jgi:hypothetical protein